MGALYLTAFKKKVRFHGFAAQSIPSSPSRTTFTMANRTAPYNDAMQLGELFHNAKLSPD